MEIFIKKKKIDIFLIFAQNIDCRYTLEPHRRGSSNEYPQSMFWSKNKKNRYTPAYPSSTIQKWGLRGYSIHVFLMRIQSSYFKLLLTSLHKRAGPVFQNFVSLSLSYICPHHRTIFWTAILPTIFRHRR